MATRKVISDITATVEIVERNSIPDNFYLPKFSHKKDWKQIFKFSFSNHFTCYYGTNKSFVDGTELMTNLTLESDIVDISKNPLDLKIKFLENFKKNINLQNCKKIYEWHKQSRDKVEDIVNQFMST
jgi:hypothetical protein